MPACTLDGLVTPSPVPRMALSRVLNVDTIGIRARFSLDQLAAIEGRFGRVLLLDEDGAIERDVFRFGSLPGSHSSSAWIKLQPIKKEDLHGQLLQASGVSLAPYWLHVEGSPHKLILGQNALGGSSDLVGLAKWLCGQAEAFLGLPALCWEAVRVDVNGHVDFASGDIALEFVRDLARSLPGVTSLRSLPRNFGTSVYAGAVKCYLKETEVLAHKGGLSSKEAYELAKKLSGILRVETCFRSKDLSRIGSQFVGDLPVDLILERSLDRMLNFLRISRDESLIVRRSSEVSDRLHSRYDSLLASTLFGTWAAIQTSSEKTVRDRLSKTTYYRHVRQLKSAGVALVGSDIRVVDTPSWSSGLQAGFIARDPDSLLVSQLAA